MRIVTVLIICAEQTGDMLVFRTLSPHLGTLHKLPSSIHTTIEWQYNRSASKRHFVCFANVVCFASLLTFEVFVKRNATDMYSFIHVAAERFVTINTR